MTAFLRRPKWSLGLILIALALYAFVACPGAISPVQQTQLRQDQPSNQSGTQPDFSVQIEPNQFLAQRATNSTPLYSTPSVVLTPLYGFVGNVTFSGAVSPSTAQAPTISSFYPHSIRLDASIPGSPSASMDIEVTNTAELGLYTVAVTATSETVSHTATATIGITDRFVPGNGALLLYEGKFNAPAYTGGSTVLNNNFSDLGYVSVGVRKIVVSLAFSTYQSILSLNLNPYAQGTTPLTILIPADVQAGNYSLTATISWVVDPGTIYETTASALVVPGFLMVYLSPTPPNPPSNPGNAGNTLNILNTLSRIMLPLLGTLAALAVLSITVVHRHERQKQFAAKDATIGLRSCIYCGASFVSPSKFCTQCGHPMN